MICGRHQVRALTLALVAIFVTHTCGYYNCIKTMHRMSKKANANDVYALEISGNPVNYVPGESYTITLKPKGTTFSKSRFRDFTVTVEHENYDILQTIVAPMVGNFRLMDTMLTRFSTNCRNTVLQTNTVPKASIQVEWVAPPPKSGCVVIKATVVESEDSWFDSTGDLSKTLCEEEEINADVQPLVLKYCCACDEAKYEVAFEGMWSRNTHPKDFPSDVWSTKFSDIVGSSHQLDYSFWTYGGFASPGLKELAEDGTTDLLEKELKANSKQIRTIIKARELAHPSITGTSYTLFRVDKDNHLLSLVSKITPSPDWVVGVSNLELCLRNCTWVDSRILNLYPWDVGTDDGVTYTSSNVPSQPQQAIKPIKSNSPNNPDSPFYSEQGDPIKPLARLRITREKLYSKACTDEDNNPDFQDNNCRTTDWSKWSSCAEDCMKFRVRKYVDPEAAENCQELLEQRKACKWHHCRKNLALEKGDSRCDVTEWSQWSSCSTTCGKGIRTRDRSFSNSEFEALCTEGDVVQLQENEECKVKDCDEEEETNEEDCPNVTWGEWSACSTTCGEGVKERYRQNNETTSNEDQEEETDSQCSKLKHMESVTCYNAPCDDETAEPGTPNQFGTLGSDSQVSTSTPWIVTQGSDGLPVIDCKVSKWSIWSPCNVTEPCKKGFKYRVRHIKIHPQNGGNPCPKKLFKKRKCKTACEKPDVSSNESKATLPDWGPSTSNEAREMAKVDCVLGPWSAWSPCSTNCGSSAVQIRTRSIKVHPTKNGRPCGMRKEEKPCPLPLACTKQGNFQYYRLL